MSSTHITHLITEYIDGTLPALQMDKVKSHLVFCNACRHMLEEIKKNVDVLKTTPLIAPSKTLEQRILNAITQKEAPVPSAPRTPVEMPVWLKWFLSYRGMSLAGAAVLMVFVVQHAPQMVRESRQEALQKKADATPAKENAQERSSNNIDSKIPTPAAPALKEADKDKGNMAIGSVGKQERSIENVKTYEYKALSDKSSVGAPKSTLDNRQGARVDSAPMAQAPTTDSLLIDNQVFSGEYSGITQPLEKVISDQKTWEEYWSKHLRNQPEKPLPFQIDFEKNQIIAVFAGNQPSAGFRVEITKVLLTQWENSPARVVRYRVVGPPEGAMAAAVLTQPFAIKVVPRTYGPTFFKKIR